MKRYIALISSFVIVLIFLCMLFYFLLKQDNSYIIYIRFQVNPSFVMGINRDYNVIFYNSLNEDGNKYNLSMFQGKKLSDSMRIFIEKLGYAKEDKKEINLTIMTKNNVLEKDIATIIEKEIKNYDKNYEIVLHDASVEELERYSNEAVYNLKASLGDDDLKLISRCLYQKLDDYIKEKMNNLKLNSLSKEDILSILKEKVEEKFFYDFDLLSVDLGKDNIYLLERSSYDIDFQYEEELSYSLRLNIELENESIGDKSTVELYRFNYLLGEDKEIIENLKINFYTF